MSGFSIELLEEGYRAVDPLARVRFPVGDRPSDLAGDLFVQICAITPVDLDIQHGASNTIAIMSDVQP